LERFILRMGLQASPAVTAALLEVPEGIAWVAQALLWVVSACGAVYLASEAILATW
jgi:hypothetical protein